MNISKGELITLRTESLVISGVVSDVDDIGFTVSTTEEGRFSVDWNSLADSTVAVEVCQSENLKCKLAA